VADLLDSLARQELVPYEWEVIVVNNGSTDDTAAITKQKSQTLSIAIRHVLEPRLGLHHSRHRGTREALGKYIGYLDDDMVLAPTWVHGVERVAQGQAEAVCGRILPKWEAQPPQWLLEMIKEGVYGYLGLLDLGAATKPVEPTTVFGGNCFLPKRLVFELGGFHPDNLPPELLCYRGDGETGLMRKFKEARLRVYYDPRATAYHVIGADKLTVEYLCKQAYYKAISASFTQIRAAYLNGHSLQDLQGLRRYLRRIREMTLSQLLKWAAKRIRCAILSVNPTYHAQIQKRLEAAYRAGWKFHQDAVRNAPELLQYVLRKDYFE
jgi:glycosyltransferase involved in cell wall biosynthesis